jgi:hypothetical protein
VSTVAQQVDGLGVGRTLLKTRDAHEVYAGLGFVPVPDPALWMIRTPPA